MGHRFWVPLHHVPMVSSIVLDYVYCTYSAHGKPYKATHKRHFQFSHFHAACREEVRRCDHASIWGSKWGDCSQMVRDNSVLNHMLIPWVSEGIYTIVITLNLATFACF